MDDTRSLAVQILNDANLCSDPKTKAELLTQLQELLVNKQPALLKEFLPEMVQLQMDQSALVRKAYAQFLGQAAQQAAAGAAALKVAAGSLAALVADGSPLVANAALRACHPILHAALALLGAQPTDAEVQAAWEAAHGMQQAAAGLVAGTTAPDGVRLSAIKLLEVSVLLYTAETAPAPPGVHHRAAVPKLPRAAALSTDAAAGLRLLLSLLRPDTARKTPGPLVICAIKAAAVVATARPPLLGRVLPGLLALAKEGGCQASDSPAVGGNARGTALSVGNALRNALASILRSRHPSSVPWRDRLVEALGILGAGAAADTALKFVARQDYKEARAAGKVQRGSDIPHGADAPDAKRARTGPNPSPSTLPAGPSGQQHTSAAPSGSAGLPHAFLQVLAASSPQQLLVPQQQSLALLPPAAAAAGPSPAAPAAPIPQQSLHLGELLAAGTFGAAPAATPAAAAPIGTQDAASAAPQQPALTSAQDMLQLHMMLPALLAHPDTSIIPAFLDSICNTAPAMLADLVMALMLNVPLPSLEEIEARFAEEEQGVGDGAAQEGDAGGAEGPQVPRSPPRPVEVEAVGGGPRGKAPAQRLGAGEPLPSLEEFARLLGRPVGSGAMQRHLPPGKCAAPAELPASAQAAAPPAPAALPPALRGVLAAGGPLVSPDPLGAEALHALRMSAVRRVASGGEALLGQAHGLWARLVSRLSAVAAATDSTSPAAQQADDALFQAMLQCVSEAVSEGKTLDLALPWLNALLAQHLAANARRASGGGGGGKPSGLAAQFHSGGEGAVHGAGVREGAPLQRSATEMDVDEVSAAQPTSGEVQGDGQADGTPPPGSDADPTTSAEGADPFEGTVYEAALLAIMHLLREQGQWQGIRDLISDAPVLTVGGVVSFLGGLASEGGEGASAALASARDIIMHRPRLRSPTLGLVLDASYDVDASTRNKAVRLCCNQLAVMLGGALASAIKAAASDALHALLHPPPADAAPEGEQPPTEWTTEEAARYCELYATLCVRHHELLPQLMDTYALSPAPVRAALLAASEGLARALGHSNAQLVALVRSPPPGSEALVAHMLETLMGALLPSEAMLTACRERYAETGDVSALAPVVPALDKTEVLALLPRLLQLPDIQLRSLYRKLATPGGALGDPLFSPAELLVALHGLDPRADGLPARSLIAAVDAALHSPDVFPQQAVAQAIQQMESQLSLPLLFMRTVITCLKALPRLKKFIAELLGRLISRQIWQDAGQWRGFLLLVEHTGPPFFPLMLQLPVPVLEQALGLGPTAPGQQPRLAPDKALALAAWAIAPDTHIQLLRPVALLMQRVLDEHGGSAAAAAAAEAAAPAPAPAESAAKSVEGSPAAATAPLGEDDPSAALAEGSGGDGGGDAAAEEGSVGVEGGPDNGGDASSQAAKRGVDEMDDFDLDFEALDEEGTGEGEEVDEAGMTGVSPVPSNGLGEGTGPME